MAARTISLILVVSALACAGCAGTMSHDASGDVYAAGGDSPADIYRTWALFNDLAHYGSVDGELRIADLYRRDRDEYRRAAANGDTVAAADLWYMYQTRSDKPSDSALAMGYYQLAADSDAGQR